jgi:hypothetical protein
LLSLRHHFPVVLVVVFEVQHLALAVVVVEMHPLALAVVVFVPLVVLRYRSSFFLL